MGTAKKGVQSPGAGLFFLMCIVLLTAGLIFLVPGEGKVVSAALNTPMPEAAIPMVCIREDTCETLLQSFCDNHGKIKYSKQSTANNYEIVIYNFGANKGLFYNNNEKLLATTNKGFKIKIRPDDTIEAIFTKKHIKGCDCVELPTDVLFALVSQHPLIK